MARENGLVGLPMTIGSRSLIDWLMALSRTREPKLVMSRSRNTVQTLCRRVKMRSPSPSLATMLTKTEMGPGWWSVARILISA